MLTSGPISTCDAEAASAPGRSSGPGGPDKLSGAARPIAERDCDVTGRPKAAHVRLPCATNEPAAGAAGIVALGTAGDLRPWTCTCCVDRRALPLRGMVALAGTGDPPCPKTSGGPERQGRGETAAPRYANCPGEGERVAPPRPGEGGTSTPRGHCGTPGSGHAGSAMRPAKKEGNGGCFGCGAQIACVCCCHCGGGGVRCCAANSCIG